MQATDWRRSLLTCCRMAPKESILNHASYQELATSILELETPKWSNEWGPGMSDQLLALYLMLFEVPVLLVGRFSNACPPLAYALSEFFKRERLCENEKPIYPCKRVWGPLSQCCSTGNQTPHLLNLLLLLTRKGSQSISKQAQARTYSISPGDADILRMSRQAERLLQRIGSLYAHFPVQEQWRSSSGTFDMLRRCGPEASQHLVEGERAPGSR